MGFSEGLSFVGKCEDFNIAVNTTLKSLILFSLGQLLKHPSVHSGSGAGSPVQRQHLRTPALPLSGDTVQTTSGGGFAPILHQYGRPVCLQGSSKPRL